MEKGDAYKALLAIAKSFEYKHRLLVATNPYTPTSILEELKDDCLDIKISIATHPNSSESLLRTLAKDQILL